MSGSVMAPGYSPSGRRSRPARQPRGDLTAAAPESLALARDPGAAGRDYDAVLFDLDGVVTPTAEVHMRAWAEMFNAFLAEYDGDPARPRRRTPTPTTSRTSTASRATTGSATSWPPAASTCPRAPDDPAPRDGLRARQPQERRVQRGARARRGDGVPGLGAAARPPARPRHAAGGRLVVGQRPGGARGRRARRPVPRPSSSGAVATERGLPGKPAPDTFVHAAAELGATRRDVGRARGRRVRACAPARPATSGWWSASTAAPGPTTLTEAGADDRRRATWPSWSRTGAAA